MSNLINELLGKVSALTQTVNQLISSSKSISELPQQNTLNNGSLLHVSRGGTSEKISVQQLVNAVINNNNDQLLSVGAITLSGNNLTIASISGKINNVFQDITTPTVVNIPYCATGLNRIDLIVYNNTNTIVRIAGTETAGTIIVAPTLPLDALLVTQVSVSDSAIGDPSLPILGTSFKKKSFDKTQTFTASGTDVVIPFSHEGYGTIELSGALTSVSGFSFTDLIANPDNAEYPHEGKEIILINRSGHDITLKNADFASLAVVFFKFDGGDIVIPNNGKLELKYTPDGLIEVFKSWNLIVAPEETLITNATVTGTYNIDWSAGDVWNLTLTGNTILTESNLPPSGKTKTINLQIAGNFTLAYPSGWVTFITGSYSGTATLNTLTCQYFGVGKYKVLISKPS